MPQALAIVAANTSLIPVPLHPPTGWGFNIRAADSCNTEDNVQWALVVKWQDVCLQTERLLVQISITTLKATCYKFDCLRK